jgi:hypothetical protein
MRRGVAAGVAQWCDWRGAAAAAESGAAARPAWPAHSGAMGTTEAAGVGIGGRAVARWRPPQDTTTVALQDIHGGGSCGGPEKGRYGH